MKHFSILNLRSVCGAKLGKHASMTGETKHVTCSRCRTMLEQASAVQADLWALEAADFLAKHPVDCVTAEHVRTLYVFALERREAELKRSQERVEYDMDELAKTAERAVAAGVRR